MQDSNLRNKQGPKSPTVRTAGRQKNTDILGAWRGVKNLHMLLLRSLVGIQTIKAISCPTRYRTHHVTLRRKFNT